MIDSERAEYTAAYTRSIVLSVILAFAYAGLLYVQPYVAQVFYEGPDMKEKAGTINMVNIVYLATSALYIIAFIVQACQQKAPDDEEIRFDSDDDGIDTSSDEDEDGLGRLDTEM